MQPNILQLISSGGFYGAERVLLEIARFARQAGWGSHVMAMESPGADAIAERAGQWGIPVFRMPGALGRPGEMRAALARHVAAERIDLIHTHGYKSDVLARWTAMDRPVRRVASCHSWYSTSARLKVYEWLDKRALRGFDHVVAVSGQILNDLRRSRLAREKTSLILNGVGLDPPSAEFDRAALRASLGVAPDERLILRVGRLAASKGNAVLLDALARLGSAARWRLLMAGEGECLDELRSQASRLGLAGRIVFAGFRPDVHDLLRLSDLMAIPSLQEGLPIVLLEAMAANVPVIATVVGEVPSVLRNGENGWLVPPGDPAPLAAALADALEHPAEAQRRAGAARADYEKHHSDAAMGEQYLALYARLLGRA